MIQPPKITWLTSLDSDDKYIERPELYAGALTPDESIEMDFQIWNNQYGVEEVQTLENFTIVMSFDHLEDSAFLKYAKMLVNHSYIIEPTINNNEAVFKMPDGFKLKGVINDGSTKSYDNYMAVRIMIEAPKEAKVKTNDLKTFSLDIVKI